MLTAIQFYLPRLAANAIDINALQFRARMAGIENATLEASYFRSGGRCRVTCKLQVAEFIDVELRRAHDAATKRDVRAACEDGLRAISAAFEEAARPDPGATPVTGNSMLGGE